MAATISHAVAAIKITMLQPVYLNMVTARLLTNYPNTLRNIHTNARENITRRRAKRKAGNFFMAHPVCVCVRVRACAYSIKYNLRWLSSVSRKGC